MKTNDLKNPPRFRAPAVHIALGTMGIMNATHAVKAEVKFGIPIAARMPVLAVETAESARTYSAPGGPDFPSVSLPDESILILRDRSTHELAAMAQRHPRTRSYARKLSALPPTSTKEGAGGHRILSLTSFLAELPELDLRIPRLLIQERDRCRFGAQSDEGHSQSGSEEMAVYISGAGYGSTCSGAALLIASRVRHHAHLLGLKVRIHLLLVSASVAKTNDSITAWANLGITCKAAMKAMEDASKIVFHTFTGGTISHEPHSRLVDTLTLWGNSTGSLVASDREETAASVGLLVFYLVHSTLAGISEQAFCDSAKMVIDRSLGYRGFRRLGIARFAVDRELNRRVAFNAAVRQISQIINPSAI